MPKYYNVSSTPLGLPGGEIIPAFSAEPVAITPALEKHDVVAGWIDDGMLSKDKAKSAGGATNTVAVPVADLDSDIVKKAIADAVEAGKADALADAKAAWEAYATLPDDAAPEALDAAEANIAKALGIDAAA